MYAIKLPGVNARNSAKFGFLAFLLTHWLPWRPYNQPWRALAFLPLLTSSILTKIGIIHMYAQLLQKEKIFPVRPRSERSAEWSIRYAQKCSKCSKSGAENSHQNLLPLHWLLHGKNCLSRWRFLRSFLTASKPSRRSITTAKRKEKEKEERRKKIPKIEEPIVKT